MNKIGLKNLLIKNRKHFKKIVDLDSSHSAFISMDLTSENKELNSIDLSNPEEIQRYILRIIKKNNKKYAIGKYNEDRILYNHSNLFTETEPRTIHLGIDLWVPEKTPIMAPLRGIVHSFKDNIGEGDYGPTIILEHNLEGVTFYTLYGHLSKDSLNNLYIGKEFNAGEVIGKVGIYPSNGNWPPHLHFQIINDMLGKFGDFPGVASSKTVKAFLENCPNPNLILNLEIE